MSDQWKNWFPRVLNGEWLELAAAGFTNATQIQIVIFLLTKTRGAPASREVFGRPNVDLYDSQIAKAIDRAEKHVARERRKLIKAGVIVEHQRGGKGRPAVLSVDLDPFHWQLSRLAPGSKSLPKAVNTCGNDSAPDDAESGNGSAPRSTICGNDSAPLLKKEIEKKTSDPSQADALGSDDRTEELAASFDSPQLQESARRLLANCDRDVSAA
jgi:hypothetical protein